MFIDDYSCLSVTKLRVGSDDRFIDIPWSSCSEPSLITYQLIPSTEYSIPVSVPEVSCPGLGPVDGVTPREAGVPGDLPRLLQTHLLLQIPVPVHVLTVRSRGNPVKTILYRQGPAGRYLELLAKFWKFSVILISLCELFPVSRPEQDTSLEEYNVREKTQARSATCRNMLGMEGLLKWSCQLLKEMTTYIHARIKW